MKKHLLAFILLTQTLHPIQSYCEEDINILAEETDEIYRPGTGAHDGAYTSLGLSMLGWGLGLAAGIGILASVLHQSTSANSHEACNANNH